LKWLFSFAAIFEIEFVSVDKFSNFLKNFVTDFLQPSLIFASKAGAYPSGARRIALL
jgi:hypothetical protein